jgi:hypothetical protein
VKCDNLPQRVACLIQGWQLGRRRKVQIGRSSAGD